MFLPAAAEQGILQLLSAGGPLLQDLACNCALTVPGPSTRAALWAALADTKLATYKEQPALALAVDTVFEASASNY